MSNSSRPQSPSRNRSGSTEKAAQNFAGVQQLPLQLDRQTQLPGSQNDGALIRALLTEVIKTCGKSRAQIADEMSYLVGQEVTERRLNGFTAESREDLRWPAELDRAFCSVTGDTRLLTCRVELHGMHVIGEDELDMLELGRAFMQQTQAEEKIAMLQARLRRRVA